MTWAVLVPMILFGIIKIAATSLPSGAVNWLNGKLETHQAIAAADVSLSKKGRPVEAAIKAQIITAFNEALFLERYPVFPGYEQAYLNPESGTDPIIMQMNKRRRYITISLYCYADRVDVVKQSGKKLIAYKLRSPFLQECADAECLLS